MVLNIIELVKSAPEESFDVIRNHVFKNDIMSSFMPDGRMIFHTSKNTRFNKIHKEKLQEVSKHNKDDELWLECNGLILDCSDFNNIKPLVIPQCSFISHYDKNIMTKNIYDGLYDIYKIEDGTIINLYYYEKMDSWRISTTRGIDMNNCKFNNISYIEILEEILNKKNIELDQFFESLNKERCYTFNIKHHSIHKFNNINGLNNNMWFIQSVDISTLETYKELDIDYISEIKKQSLIENTDNIINKNNEKSVNDYLYKKTINLGYILKSKDPTITQTHSNILIESGLMSKIRQLLYNSKFIKIAKEFDIDKEIITVISAYLNINNRLIFIKLFPEYKSMYNILDNITSEQVNKVLKYYSKIYRLSNDNTLYDEITVYLYNTINKLYNFSMVNPMYINQLITNYLINDNNITIYVNLYKSMSHL